MLADDIAKQRVHHALKLRWSICKSKRHDKNSNCPYFVMNEVLDSSPSLMRRRLLSSNPVLHDLVFLAGQLVDLAMEKAHYQAFKSIEQSNLDAVEVFQPDLPKTTKKNWTRYPEEH
ncbi:hypothetical protein BASA82_001107 [Batrachochytrium salamandrivorans]|nr:hypothetical protein BASA82_001107 [Batrachochytrium salamandrivorans]